MQKIIGFEKLSLVDYPSKMAATIFIGGCNFRCPFCHNSIIVGDDNLLEYSEDEILQYLFKRRGILEAVTITGGEPTFYNGLEELIDKIKELGYLVKLDTNGTQPDVVRKLLNKVDYFAMDIKNSYELYPITTGVTNPKLFEKVKETINILMNEAKDYEFRTTLVSEFHNDDSIKGIGELVKGAKRIYLQHFVDRGTCIEENLHEVEKEDAIRFKDILKKYVLHAEIRNYD